MKWVNTLTIKGFLYRSTYVEVNLIQTKQANITFSKLLKFQFRKAKNWGRSSSPEGVRIAIVLCSECLYSFSFAYVVSFLQFAASPHLGKNGPVEASFWQRMGWWRNFFHSLQLFKELFQNIYRRSSSSYKRQSSKACRSESFVYCRNNGITVNSSSCYTSRRSQSCDLAFYGHLKATFKKKYVLQLKRCMKKIDNSDSFLGKYEKIRSGELP